MKPSPSRYAQLHRKPLRASTFFGSVSIVKPQIFHNAIARRYASSGSQSTGTSKIINFFYGTTLALGIGIVYVYVTDTRASVHKYVVVPALRMIYHDPERAHEAGNYGLKSLWRLGLYPRERGDPDSKGDLTVEVFGHVLRNPIGTSAGIDKHAEILDPLMAIGPAIVEIGGTTPQPQPGNDKPRVFRLASQNAMINRYGLNSEGADHVAARLRHRVREFAYENGLGHDDVAEKLVLDGGANVPPGSLTKGKLLAINIAKNKSTPENDIQAVTDDYVYCVQRLAPYADILVVNVSSPNTPGLRSLQQGESLRKLLGAVVETARSTDRKTKPSVMVKVSPDEDSDEQVLGIAQAVWEAGVDGVIVGNTTNRRPEPLPHLQNMSPLEQQHLLEQGGFSGPHLFERTVALVKRYKTLLNDRPVSVGRSTNTSSGIIDEVKASVGSRPPPGQDAVSRSVETQVIPLHNPVSTPDADKKPLINIPSSKVYSQSTEEQNKLNTGEPSPDPSPSAANEKSEEQDKPTRRTSFDEEEPKVIFATGGITNGRQALEAMDAGASVAMVYTALVYGGVGTISRIKDEMREELSRRAVSTTKNKK